MAREILTEITPPQPQDVVAFFDPNNDEHLRAYAHLNNTGNWPEWFMPQIQNLKFSPGWVFGVQYKLAGEWLKHKLGS